MEFDLHKYLESQGFVRTFSGMFATSYEKETVRVQLSEWQDAWFYKEDNQIAFVESGSYIGNKWVNNSTYEKEIKESLSKCFLHEFRKQKIEALLNEL